MCTRTVWKGSVEEWELGLGLETQKTEWATRKRKVFQSHTKGGAEAEGASPPLLGTPILRAPVFIDLSLVQGPADQQHQPYQKFVRNAKP